MSDLELFEARLATAYRRYVDTAPPPPDAGAVVRTVLERQRPRSLVWPWEHSRVRASSWALLVLALVVALVGAALVASRLLEARIEHLRVNVPLAPTGIDVLATDAGSLEGTVADGKGILWAVDNGGRLLRFNPATGSARTWTVTDDAAFAMPEIAPARAGGVWLRNGATLRLFDGEVFRQVIEAPADIERVTEAPDTTLWAASVDGTVLHWDGSSWSTLDPGRPTGDPDISAITVDTAGQTWVGWQLDRSPSAGGVVSRYDGSVWTSFDAADAAPLGGDVSSIAEAPGGDIWVATSIGLARFDGSSWTDESVSPGMPASVAVSPAGEVWVAVGSPESGMLSVWRFEGQSWTTHGDGPSDGLPGLGGGYATAWMAPTTEGVYLGAAEGIFRLSNDHWQPAWRPTSAPSAVASDSTQIALAVSRDEFWLTGPAGTWSNGLWHFKDGTWAGEPIDPRNPRLRPNALALAPDGTAWAAWAQGVAYWRDGHWTVVDTHVASAILVDHDATVWVAGEGSWEPGPDKLWTLRLDGTEWTRRVVTPHPPIPREGGASLGIDGAGSLWLGAPHGFLPGGLARFDGHTWQTIDEINGTKVDGASVLGTAPDGSIWLDVQSAVELDGRQWIWHKAARFDGSAWMVVELPIELPSQSSAPRLGSDGTLWTTTLRGPARLDGAEWTYPYDGVKGSWRTPWVAPDGTAFGTIGSSIVRFPAAAP